jgi:LCP family protein required for cell wall assembly
VPDASSNDQPGKPPGRRAGRPRRRRWPKRVLIAGGVVVVLVVALGFGGYFYLSYQFHKIKKVTVHHLQKVPVPKPGKPASPFTVLLVGSDSRAFVDTPGECVAYSVAGDCKESDTGGQRSDVTILVRVVPATHHIEMMSIPRDTWVAIPGHVPYISGENRINAAFNNGPSLLVETIEQDFHIPVNYYVDVNFIGLQNMVDAIGGIHLDFPYPIRDAESGLDTLTTGCQIVHGGRALALVRSRNIEWEASPGVWDNDPYSDFTRIRNQQTFFRAVIHQLNAEITNPIALNGFISAAAKNLTIDQTLSEGTLISMAREFHNFPPGSLKTETLPTVGPYITDGGEVEALLPAAKADEVMIKAFLAFGMPAKAKATTTTTTTAPAGSSTTTTTTTTANDNDTTVTTVAPTPAGETPIYNTQSEPYDVKNC